MILGMFKGSRITQDNSSQAIENYKNIVDLKNNFQCKRVDAMNLEEYQQFQYCRESNLRPGGQGKKLFTEHLAISGDKKFMDALAYTLRFIIRSAVEIATLDKDASD